MTAVAVGCARRAPRVTARPAAAARSPGAVVDNAAAHWRRRAGRRESRGTDLLSGGDSAERIRPAARPVRRAMRHGFRRGLASLS